MRHVVQWLENARIQLEKGNKIKRWKRGMSLLRSSRYQKGMVKEMNEETDIAELEKKAEARLDELLEERDNEDESKRKVERLLKKMEEIKEDERCTKSFFDKFKTINKAEKIECLLDEEKEKKEEVTDLEGLMKIATNFYKDLWKKRKTDKDAARSC